MGVVEREVRGPSHGTALLPAEGGAVRFADILNEGDVFGLETVQQLLVHRVVAKDMGEKDGAGVRTHLGEDLVHVHAESMRIDIHEDWGKASLQNGSDVGNPSQGGDDDFSGSPQFAQGAHGDEVCGGTGVDEDAVPHSKPLGPLLFEGADLGGLGQHRLGLLQISDQGVQILSENVVLHEGPIEHRAGGSGGRHRLTSRCKNLPTPLGECSCRRCG